MSYHPFHIDSHHPTGLTIADGVCRIHYATEVDEVVNHFPLGDLNFYIGSRSGRLIRFSTEDLDRVIKVLDMLVTRAGCLHVTNYKLLRQGCKQVLQQRNCPTPLKSRYEWLMEDV